MKLRSALLQALAATLGALALARLLYATAWGQWLLGLVPERLWSALFNALALQGAESTSTLEIAVVLLFCGVAAAVVVRLVAGFVRRFRARSGAA